MYFSVFLSLLIHGSNVRRLAAEGFQHVFELRIRNSHPSIELCTALGTFAEEVAKIGWDSGRMAYEKYRFVSGHWRVEFGEIIVNHGTASTKYFPEGDCGTHANYPVGIPNQQSGGEAGAFFRYQIVEMCHNLRPTHFVRVVSDLHTQHPGKDTWVSFARGLVDSIRQYKNTGHIKFFNRHFPRPMCTYLPGGNHILR